jgi:Cft2 family RNA processing exonuclease
MLFMQTMLTANFVVSYGLIRQHTEIFMDESSNKVIIVGGGAVGLTLAYLLTQNNIPVVIIEQEKQITKETRATTIQPAILDLFHHYPVVKTMVETGLIATDMQYWDGDTLLNYIWDKINLLKYYLMPLLTILFVKLFSMQNF